MPYPNEHAARIRDPGDFEPTSFRSKDLKDGIRIIVGQLKGETSMIVQAYRFGVDKFTVEQAKKWLEDHKLKFIKFEPASENGGTMNNNLEHAGIKGMRWGQRNKRDMPGETGGKKPKSVSSEVVAKLKKNMPGETGGKHAKNASADAKEVAGFKGKHVSEMSNEELQKFAKRMDLEKKFKDLNPSRATKGKKKIEGLFSTVGKTAGFVGSAAALVITGKKLYDLAKMAKTATKLAGIKPDFMI